MTSAPPQPTLPDHPPAVPARLRLARSPPSSPRPHLLCLLIAERPLQTRPPHSPTFHPLCRRPAPPRAGSRQSAQARLPLNHGRRRAAALPSGGAAVPSTSPAETHRDCELQPPPAAAARPEASLPPRPTRRRQEGRREGRRELFPPPQRPSALGRCPTHRVCAAATAPPPKPSHLPPKPPPTPPPMPSPPEPSLVPPTQGQSHLTGTHTRRRLTLEPPRWMAAAGTGVPSLPLPRTPPSPPHAPPYSHPVHLAPLAPSTSPARGILSRHPPPTTLCAAQAALQPPPKRHLLFRPSLLRPRRRRQSRPAGCPAHAAAVAASPPPPHARHPITISPAAA
jgi:hypothetical protein